MLGNIAKFKQIGVWHLTTCVFKLLTSFYFLLHSSQSYLYFPYTHVFGVNLCQSNKLPNLMFLYGARIAYQTQHWAHQLIFLTSRLGSSIFFSLEKPTQVGKIKVLKNAI